MTMRSTDCTRWHQDIRAWVAEGTVAEPLLQQHLAACADCRRYAQQMRSAAAGLRWMAERPVEPSTGFRARWTQAVEEAAEPASMGETITGVAAWWRAWLLRNRRPALALASLWLLALLLRFTAPDVSTASSTTIPRSPVEIARALKAHRPLLAWQVWKRSLQPAPPPHVSAPLPRSEGLPARPAAQRSEPEAPLMA